MAPSPRILAIAALAASVPLAAFIRNERSIGAPFFVATPEAVAYRVHAGTEAGMVNTDGGVIISPTSTPTAAVLAAFETWNRIEGSRVRFTTPIPEPSGNAQPEGVNLITFADTPNNRALTFGAIAVTRLLSGANGVLEDTDIVFNPEMPFSTTLEPGTFDIQGALTHELGHALGMDHSGSVGAVMFATATRGAARLRRLSEDDAAFLREVYPSEVPHESGAIEGIVRSSAGGVAIGAIVTAFDPSRNTAVSAITELDGRFRIPRLAPASYGLIVEPLDGPATPFQLSFSRRNANTFFQTLIAGGAAGPLLTPVAVNAAARVELTVQAGLPVYNFVGLSAALPGEAFETRAGAEVPRGVVYKVRVDGDGLDDPGITLDSLRILGAGVEILPTPLERGRTRLTDGTDYANLQFEIRVLTEAPLGAATLVLTTARGEAAFTTGFEIVDPEPRPAFSAEGVVNAASYAGGAVAPGALLSIFGENLAPTAVAGYLDPVTRRVGDLLTGVSVRFNGKPAAMLFVNPGQLNVQAPPDLTPGNAALTVDRNGVTGPAISLDVSTAAPGLFEGPAGGALAVRLDGVVIRPETPARRGDFITLYGAGAGAVTPSLRVGEPARADPLSLVEQNVEIVIGGLPAEVQFAGMAPGFAGLLQINVKIPEDAPQGPSVPLLVRVGGVAAPQRSLSID